jgi:uroporphyrinogen decarboxylase
MTRFTKERFREICQGERPGDFGILGNGFHMFWPETLAMWVERGAPTILETQIGGADGFPAAVEDFFHFDETHLLHEIHSGIEAGSVMLNNFHGTSFQDCSFLACPPYEPEVIEEDELALVFMNMARIKQRLLKEKPFNMPQHLEYPVKDRATWNEYKKRLDPDTPERYPSNWNAFVERINRLECPVQMEIGGFFGNINMWVGTENLMYLFYDDPALIDEMMSTVLHLEIAMVERVTKDIKVDLVRYWEDMAYKSGSMISPDMVRRHMLPLYERLNDVVRKSGCDIIFLDCDGNIEQLIPLWLEAGIRFMWPLECAAGMDAVALRKKYGKDIILGGGLDKREFLRDKASLRKEVMSKVPFLSETGPYFPSPDHLVPIDMPFEHFCYYINLLRQIRGDEMLSF